VVDDHLEAGYLLSRLLRRGGYEVAELHDLDAVVETLTELDGSVAAIVATFTHAGTAASLHLLDVLRSHVDPRLNSPRILLTADESRQQIFCLQAGADAVLLRPFTDVELTEAVDRIERAVALGIRFRIGINCGPVVAGVIGTKKFIYDIWGDTVNLAARMESLGSPGRVHVSSAVRERLGDAFEVDARGLIEIKGKGHLPTFFVLGRRDARKGRGDRKATGRAVSSRSARP
jgi:class 3 adenylate cyclase